MDEEGTLDVSREHYPYAIVWSPLPVLSWFLPFIGHMGICDSRGVIYDFAGPYTIGEDDFAFGAPTRYLTLDPAKIRSGTQDDNPIVSWNQCVARGSKDYSKRMHNLFCDNCHSHVARCLNYMQYDGADNWNMVILCFWVFFRGTFVSPARAVQTYLPSLLILAIVVAVNRA